MNMILTLFLLAIFISLFAGLFFLVKDQSQSKRTVKSLTWRISLSVILFLAVLIGILTGAIQPQDPFRGAPPSTPEAVETK